MKLVKYFRIILILLLLMVGVFYYNPAKAQQAPSGIQISPVRFDWDMNSGQERMGVVNLKNYDNIEREIKIEKEDFYVTDNSSEARFFIPDEKHPLKAYDVINWIEVEEGIKLAPGEGKDIYFKVKVPAETPTGGYYGAIFFNVSMDSNQESQGSRVKINQRIGTLLVMAVKGNQAISRSGQVVNFETVKKIFLTSPVDFVVNFANSGNLHFKVLGNIEIYKFGKKIDNINIDPRIAYPGKVREYKQLWNFSSWAYGYYKAKLTMTSEDGSIDSSKEISFWIIPWKTTLSIAIIIVIVVLLLKLLGSKFEIKRKGDE